MSKYTEAISSIYFTMHNRVRPKTLGYCEDKNLEVLEELVERATPKKPINQSTPLVRQGYCPNCKGELRKLGSRNEVVLEGQLYCSSCGQALDWSEE